MFVNETRLLQLFKPIEYAAIVCYQISAETFYEILHDKSTTSKHEISNTVSSTNVRHGTLQSLSIMSPRYTMFIQETSKLDVSWRQAVRAEVFTATVGIYVDSYPMFSGFTRVVRVAHEGDGVSVYLEFVEYVFGYDPTHDDTGVRIAGE